MDAAGKNADMNDDAAIRIVMAVKNKGAQLVVGQTRRRRNALDDRLEKLVDARADFCGNLHGDRRVKP